MSELIAILVGLGVLGFTAWFLFWLMIQVPRDMARERKRDPVAWVLLSLLGSPFLAILLLLWLGEVER